MKLQTPNQHDRLLLELWQRLQPLLAPPVEPPTREIGFHVKERRTRYRVRSGTKPKSRSGG